ncbi:MAG: DUF362 domain-containing protein [Gaiellales bacterium]|nr:MAG: DUF362 domain-containing protein [Gaiellales bacterium]
MNHSATVAVERCEDYDEAAVTAAVAAAVENAGGLAAAVSPGDRVLIKANLLAPVPPEAAVTTHPAMVKAAIAMVREAGGEPLVADSPGFLFVGGEDSAIEASGVKQACDEMGADSFQFEQVERPYVETEVPGGQWLSSIYAARLALEADAIITLPKLKTHENTMYTGAVKNMFGAVAARTRKKAHRAGSYERFSAAVVDIFSALKPGFAIMDAIVGMEGSGPRHGEPRQVGLVLASPDPVALDAIATAIAGFRPGEVATTRIAAGRGLGIGDLGSIDIAGVSIREAAVRFRKPGGLKRNLPSFLFAVADRLTRVQPACAESVCTQCGQCRLACPVAAISMAPYPVIDRERCIECYCCNELCPTGAMELRRSWLARRLV